MLSFRLNGVLDLTLEEAIDVEALDGVFEDDCNGDWDGVFEGVLLKYFRIVFDCGLGKDFFVVWGDFFMMKIGWPSLYLDSRQDK